MPGYGEQMRAISLRWGLHAQTLPRAVLEVLPCSCLCQEAHGLW